MENVAFNFSQVPFWFSYLRMLALLLSIIMGVLTLIYEVVACFKAPVMQELARKLFSIVLMGIGFVIPIAFLLIVAELAM